MIDSNPKLAMFYKTFKVEMGLFFDKQRDATSGKGAAYSAPFGCAISMPSMPCELRGTLHAPRQTNVSHQRTDVPMILLTTCRPRADHVLAVC